MSLAELDALSLGFRSRHLSFDELGRQLSAWQRAFPELVHLESIGTSPEGRELWLLTLGRDRNRTRPAAWIDGNLHASELAGSSAALAIAEDVLRLHLAPDSALHGLPPHVREVLRDVLFYVLPRISPDGAEAVLDSGRWVRSVPRRRNLPSHGPSWRAQYVDGDGLSLLMRVPDETGEWCELKQGVLVPRELDDAGPFYKLYPEGIIENFDGDTIPNPRPLIDSYPDLNRNFPWQWAPEPHQIGAGPFATSEPESRAVVEFAVRHPNIFAWLNFHTFGGVFIRPLGDAPDKKMNPGDRALFEQIAEWAEQFTGYPMVSGYDEFTYEEEKPLHGDLSDFAYHQRGAIAYVCELWDLFRRIGMQRPRRFCEHYTHMTRDDRLRLARWDAEHNDSRIHRPWRQANHPQLGAVEVGGFDPRVGIWNPPPELLPEVCTGQSAAFLRVAALTPRLCLALESEGSGDAVSVRAVVENRGYLPTCVLDSARQLPEAEPPIAELSAGDGLRILGPPRQSVGHLDGWGRGVKNRDIAFHVPRSRGNTSRRVLRWTVQGRGPVRLRVTSPRLGVWELESQVG